MDKQLLSSVILATAVVAGGIWVADHSLPTKSVESATAGKEAKTFNSGHPDASQKSAPQPAGADERSMAASSSSGISKCTISGKTIYSNNGCPDGARSQAIALHDSAGIVSPPKESRADLTTKRKASERVYALQAQAQVTVIGRSDRGECEEFDRRVAELDGMARQPHSGVMQDWIKNERKAVRDRQFAIRC